MKNTYLLVIVFLLMNAIHLIAVSTILVTGGAGYIGSHVAYRMKQEGYRVVILDKMHNNEVQNWAEFIEGDVGDKQLLADIFSHHDIKAVVHCAAFLQVGESVKDPLKYYCNNVVNTLILLETMLEHGVKTFIFSSSAAVYGLPKWIPLTEDHSRNPINPYGNTKLMIEIICQDFSRAYGLKFVMLRYFNAAGGAPEWGLGEVHDPETHLIPLILRAALHKKPFYIFGTDYPTADGTCVRDFIHVLDIAQAHICALNYLHNGGTSDYFNLGTGHGFSVSQVIDEVKRVCNIPINIISNDRRPGDPAVLVADPSKAHDILRWEPQYSQLDTMIQSAYQFMCQHTTYVT